MDESSAPLADYFWIAGIESISYQDFPSSATSTQVDTVIAEDGEPEDADEPNGLLKRAARRSQQNAGHRLSKSSIANTIHTLDELDGNTRSNRSSATIRPVPTPAAAAASQDGLLSMADFDFDKALVKFAAERENFLDDLSFSAGAKTQARPPMVNPRTERIKADENASGRLSPLKSIRGSIRGSIRRKISFKDMSSARKPPGPPKPGKCTYPSTYSDNAVVAASIKTARRLSNYNSVIPPPEPLNLDPDMHPLKRRFEPELLDRYPPRNADEDLSRRGRFPDYVPMFAFPNDIQIVSSDDRPRSTWHGFTMTSDDSSRIYGITVVVWTAVPADTAEDIERRCEQWRQSHMSNEERELAGSLGTRLAAERAHLSQLLAKLPTIPSGSAARERLDEQISAVEEKISLMTEMLRPLRHGAASKIDGLTAGESGLWTPRAYGILGRDPSRIGFWKDWLRAVVVPMTDGGVLRVPASSPRVGRWQPLERYVVNLCAEAFSPLSSKTQVEIGVRELRLYARKEAANELPGSRSIDLYALFRCLSLENVVTLFEYAMSESRIILLSSHTSMLHLAAHALLNLLYPLTWVGVFIPILPARLLSALEAPCPYIVGIERRYDHIELPDDDYVLVDLDKDTIDATNQPVRLPKQHRRKLMALLQLAAPHQIRYGVTTGPPPYAIESYPYDAFAAENEGLFNERAKPSTLSKWVSQSSTTFGEAEPAENIRPPIFNVFPHAKPGAPDRPSTSKSNRTSPQSSVSPTSAHFPPVPITPISRSDSGFALSATLREKRSGNLNEPVGRRSSSFGQGPVPRPNPPFLNGHQPNASLSAISVNSQSSYGGGYAPSTYAQSTIAASTIMPNMLIQPVHNTDTVVWVEGHCFHFQAKDNTSVCAICDERAEGDGCYKCTGCNISTHGRCLGCVSVVCPIAFNADKVRAAFVRCYASLLYTYRKHLGRPSKEQKTNGQLYAFDMNGFIRNLPYDQQDYVTMMKDTQAFNEFIHERELKPAADPEVRLFDEVLLAKKSRGKPGLSGLSRLSTIRASHGLSSSMGGLQLPSRSSSSSSSSKSSSYLADTYDHLWRTASVPVPNAKFTGDYRSVTTRIPARLDTSLMKEPRAIQGVPRPEQRTRGFMRKQVPSMVALGNSVPTISHPGKNT
ncbi:AEX-3 domain-containing protein [Microdochium trichocladiopsis]|uniref:AEX-3 domain-containing protein n=1 Tax=Microdochium trichocladiopsis TaxID=1682393 RepID=A0A9P8YJB5_9PEZI|nr:AEX-3 domain-containing protein [Microdochium trichocladiopsis]KAH7040456.1 AEX-3 domain-containing protein [Microdochium trichocladiopsis]